MHHYAIWSGCLQRDMFLASLELPDCSSCRLLCFSHTTGHRSLPSFRAVSAPSFHVLCYGRKSWCTWRGVRAQRHAWQNGVCMLQALPERSWETCLGGRQNSLDVRVERLDAGAGVVVVTDARGEHLAQHVRVQVQRDIDLPLCSVWHRSTGLPGVRCHSVSESDAGKTAHVVWILAMPGAMHAA